MSDKRTRDYTRSNRPMASGHSTIRILGELEAQLDYLLARKYNIPQEVSHAANLLKRVGLGARTLRLDLIKEEKLDDEIELLEMRIDDEESAYKKRKMEQQCSDAYTIPLEQPLVKVSFVVPGAVRSLRQLRTAVNCAPVVDMALIEALEYLGELDIFNAAEEELYSSLKRNVKRDPEKGVLRNHIATFLRSKLESTLRSTLYEIEVDAPLVSDTKMDICIRPSEQNQKYAPIIIEITNKQQFIGSKEGQAVACAQDMHHLEHPRVLCVVMYVDCYKIISFKAWGAYRLKSKSKNTVGEYGYSELLCADPKNAFSKLIYLFDWWIKNAKILKDETTLPYCDVSTSARASILTKSTTGSNVYKYYNIDDDQSREACRSPLLYEQFLDVEKKEDMKIYRIQEFRCLLKYKTLEGSHKFRNVGQIRALIRSLRRMHEKDYVHGDIRCSNIVVSNDGYECRLIDFDYSGKEDIHSYPRGWNEAIDDGERHPDAIGCNRLKKCHDIFALLAICRLYQCQNQQKWGVIAETYYNESKATESMVVTLEDIEKALEEIPPDEELVAVSANHSV